MTWLAGWARALLQLAVVGIGWQPVQGLSLVLALALAVETIFLVRAIGAHEPGGVANRAYAVTSIGWTASTALRLTMIARS